ncbi:MAG: hypothetical protein AAGH74_02355 [Pseudomonadota bacterium]
MRTALLIAALITTSASAQEVMSPEAFREYAEGYTLYFEEGGEPFGTESFAADGSTKWRYRDGSCVDGAWRPHGGQVCFYYGDGQGVLCWRMLRDGDDIIARLLGDAENAGMELRITRRDKKPLLCGDPGTQL